MRMTNVGCSSSLQPVTLQQFEAALGILRDEDVIVVSGQNIRLC